MHVSMTKPKDTKAGAAPDKTLCIADENGKQKSESSNKGSPSTWNITARSPSWPVVYEYAGPLEGRRTN